MSKIIPSLSKMWLKITNLENALPKFKNDYLILQVKVTKKCSKSKPK